MFLAGSTPGNGFHHAMTSKAKSFDEHTYNMHIHSSPIGCGRPQADSNTVSRASHCINTRIPHLRITCQQDRTDHAIQAVNNLKCFSLISASARFDSSRSCSWTSGKSVKRKPLDCCQLVPLRGAQSGLYGRQIFLSIVIIESR